MSEWYTKCTRRSEACKYPSWSKQAKAAIHKTIGYENENELITSPAIEKSKSALLYFNCEKKLRVKAINNETGLKYALARRSILCRRGRRKITISASNMYQNIERENGYEKLESAAEANSRPLYITLCIKIKAVKAYQSNADKRVKKF